VGVVYVFVASVAMLQPNSPHNRTLNGTSAIPILIIRVQTAFHVGASTTYHVACMDEQRSPGSRAAAALEGANVDSTCLEE
jgi:hypothetical protein